MTPYITRMHRVTINILCLVTHLVTELFRDAIPNTLMWPVLVEKVVFSVAIMILPLSSRRSLSFIVFSFIYFAHCITVSPHPTPKAPVLLTTPHLLLTIYQLMTYHPPNNCHSPKKSRPWVNFGSVLGQTAKSSRALRVST